MAALVSALGAVSVTVGCVTTDFLVIASTEKLFSTVAVVTRSTASHKHSRAEKNTASHGITPSAYFIALDEKFYDLPRFISIEV